MKIAFANISFIIDFDSEEEAKQYKIKNMGKGWWFGEITYYSADNTWSMEVRRPYGKYCCGW